MNAQLIATAFCTALALALGSLGPGDECLSTHVVRVVGGADCNASDYITWDCVELPGKMGSCTNEYVGADQVQQCRDLFVQSTTVCTENLCENVTKNKVQFNSGCTQVGCATN